MPDLRRWIVGPDPREVGHEPDPRFSYANERTFLAWNRTALALISVGLVVSNLLPPFDLPVGRRVIALPLIVLGGLSSIWSIRQWADNERAMRTDTPLPASRLPAVLALVIGLVAVVAAVFSAFGTQG